MPPNGDVTDAGGDVGDGSDPVEDDAAGGEDGTVEGDPELTRFERAFRDRPVARDLVLFGFLAGFYGGAMWLLVSVPATWAVGMGVAFGVAWLALMELYWACKGTSMLRSIGEDPLE